MANKQPQIVTIDGTEYDVNDFNEQEILYLNHCVDLDRKISSTQFQLQQLLTGKDAFLGMLKAELAKPAAATKPAKAGDEIDNFGRAPAASVATDGAGVKELTDTIASIKLVRANSMRVTLSSGQVWRQAIDKAYLLKTGEKVSIRPSGWGDSYRLYSERLGSYIQVDRVDQ